MVLLSTYTLILSLIRVAVSRPFTPRQDSSVSVELDGVTYVNKGLVGFGFIPADFRESTGDTLGGIGSAIAFKQGTYQVLANGSATGTIVVHPDRGFNIDGTVDYQARQFEIDVVLNPYYGSDDLDFEDAQKTVQLTYQRTVLQFDRGHTRTTGLDALAVRPAQSGFPSVVLADPEMPIASEQQPQLTIDAEGLVANSDGSYWVSDEYGPYIYRFDSSGQLIQTIQPPDAILPLDSDGNLNFTSEVDPTTGRTGNQGFEGLTLDPENNVLYAMLQSATIQDGGDDKSTSRYTRLLAYDVSNPTVTRPSLIGEWVVPLPISNSKGNTRACSEIHFVSPGVFLALSRDGDGRGGDDTESKYKNADLFSIANATDIHGSKFDDPSNPIAKKGKLDKSITPAEYVEFVSFIDDDQLARFGLHNDDPDDQTLLDAKWESLALAPVGDPDFPNDYFLFTFADNDFLTTNGISVGQPYDAGIDVDNQVLVFRLTLPSVVPGSVEKALGISA
ncbi:hypothetical protein K435DRAFT_719132 [Dendrothele bispora CBS 962.96]|uniref:Phytase-like domain-containing protein n=1 Tax=Dendrothele bispora (strain CBS 962.96) TaxID=1314807 RepID=A0A4S8MCN3_DENBC|nr:hypothetical protein K435DRAFT_719132 [Dendrothele bispora CBS 962.96]